MEITTKSTQETQEFGREIGSRLKGGEVIALTGTLGAGKTTLVQGIARGLGITSVVTSPTFILMRSYQIESQNNEIPKTLYHVDLYRLEDNVEKEIENLGILDLWGKPDSIFIIEWAEKLKNIPPGATHISLKTGDHDTRDITVTTPL